MSRAASKLSINRLLDRKPLDGAATDAPEQRRFGKAAHEVERQVGDGSNVRCGFGHGRISHGGIIWLSRCAFGISTKETKTRSTK